MALLVRRRESRQTFDPKHPGDPALVDYFGGRSTAAGVDVTIDRALTHSAFYAGVRLKAQAIATLPLHVYERVPRGTGERDAKRRAREHPLYRVLHDQANPETTAFEWRRDVQGHVESRGNGYSEIEFDGTGNVRALWLLRPDRVTLERRGPENRLVYRVQVPGFPDQILPSTNVLHIRGLGGNGLQGYSTLKLARESLGLGLAQDEFAARVFSGDGSPSGVLTHPGALSDEAGQRIRASWQAAHSGLSNAHRIAVLEEGVQWQQVGLSNEDSQFLESRKFNVSEMARWLNIPPHKLRDLERATFSNIEQQELDFVIDSLQPDLTNWEKRIFVALFTERERQRYFAEFDVRGRLRGDSAARAQFYQTLWGLGAINANEIRAAENENPREDEGGEAYFSPLNFVSSEERDDPLPPPTPEPRGAPVPAELRHLEDRGLSRAEIRSANSRRRLAIRGRPLFENVARQIITAETREVRKILKRLDPGDEDGERSRELRQNPELLREIEALYGPQGALRDLMLRAAGPAFTTFAGLVHDDSAEELGTEGDPDGLERLVASLVIAYAVRHSVSSEARLRKAIARAEAAGTSVLDAIDETLVEWREGGRAADIASRESVSMVGPVHKVVAKRVGHSRQVWVAFGENCPFCTQLNGRTIGISAEFIAAGQTLDPNDDGQTAPLTPKRSVLDPPSHQGCDCTIITRP